MTDIVCWSVDPEKKMQNGKLEICNGWIWVFTISYGRYFVCGQGILRCKYRIVNG